MIVAVLLNLQILVEVALVPQVDAQVGVPTQTQPWRQLQPGLLDALNGVVAAASGSAVQALGVIQGVGAVEA